MCPIYREECEKLRLQDEAMLSSSWLPLFFEVPLSFRHHWRLADFNWKREYQTARSLGNQVYFIISWNRTWCSTTDRPQHCFVRMRKHAVFDSDSLFFCSFFTQFNNLLRIRGGQNTHDLNSTTGTQLFFYNGPLSKICFLRHVAT